MSITDNEDHYLVATNGRAITPLIDSESAMAELEAMISAPPQVPAIGLSASSSMKTAFDSVVEDVLRLSQENVDRALAIQQEAQSYASVLRQTGELLCQKIENEAARARTISLVMREARERLVEVQGPPVGG